MSRPGPLLLAGGGHSHALLLRRWTMRPEQRPKGLITLINRSSTALYSGMVPGLIAGQYNRDAVAIDLRQLCDRAGVALVIAEITGLDTNRRQLLLKDRPPCTTDGSASMSVRNHAPPTIPGFRSNRWSQPCKAVSDQDGSDGSSVRVIGGGPAGQEVVLALRRRWPRRSLELVSRSLSNDPAGLARMKRAGITVLTQPSATAMATLLCTGSQAPPGCGDAGLPVDGHGRIQTSATLEVCGHRDLFASGDCGVIRSDPRPPSGVWAVRSATNAGPQSARRRSGPRPAALATATAGTAADGRSHNTTGPGLGALGPTVPAHQPHLVVDQATHRSGVHGGLPPQSVHAGDHGGHGLPRLCRQTSGRSSDGSTGAGRTQRLSRGCSTRR